MTLNQLFWYFCIMMMVIILAGVLFGLFPRRCYVCRKWGIEVNMDADCTFGSGPETAEFASRHRHCRAEDYHGH